MATTTFVPELLAKKLKRDEALATATAAAAVEIKKKSKANRCTIFKKAAGYAKEYKAEEVNLINLKREAKAQGGFYCPPEAKLVFVVRIKGLNKVHPKVKKILQLLRLRAVNMGVFLRVNKATLGMLKRVEPYITFGYPNLKSVRELVYKRGYAKIKNNRIPLTDNSIIEEHLGKCGLICMEDIIHEIVTVGPHFKNVTNFLWPFKLCSATGGMAKKRVHFVEGGQAGNREELINGVIRKMN
eukprot:gene24019-9594_t